MVEAPAAAPRTLRSFQIATPVVRTETGDLATIAALSVAATVIWLLILPLEFVLFA